MSHTAWAVIDRPYSIGRAAVGALYERPEKMPSRFCATHNDDLLERNRTNDALSLTHC